MTRSPSKRYRPTWRIRAMGWFLRAIDVFLFRRERLSPTYKRGPWCISCVRNWPDDSGPWPRRMNCPCGQSDPVAMEAWERERRLPPGTGELFGINPLFAMLAAGAFLLAKKPWWRAFGLSDRPEDASEAKRAYRQALRTSHPDHGGSLEQMQKVQGAWAQAERDYGGAG